MNAEPDSGREIICDNTQSAGCLINCVRHECTGAPNENIAQNHLNIALLNVF